MTATTPSSNPFTGIIIRESLDDGSDFSNPAADYRRLFLGEDGALHLKDSAGTVTDVGGAGGAVATDAIFDAAGDLVQGTGANMAARLALGAAGTVVRSTGSTNAYAYPSGHEFAYNEITADVTIAGADEANATTIVTASEVTFDGSTVVVIEFFSSAAYTDNQANAEISFFLYDGSTSLGYISALRSGSTSRGYSAIIGKRRLTPSGAAHTYSIRASESTNTDDAKVLAGAGTVGVQSPTYIRITKV